MNWCKALLLPLLTTAPLAMGQGTPPPQFLESYQACLNTKSESLPVDLEQATNVLEHRFGLMERTSLPENAGMLFVYPEDQGARSGFWMYNTLIPLDIAWLDEKGVIVSMATMVPCETESASKCPSWVPGVRYRNVLEMNAGYFDAHNVQVGDKLVANLNNNVECPLAD